MRQHRPAHVVARRRGAHRTTSRGGDVNERAISFERLTYRYYISLLPAFKPYFTGVFCIALNTIFKLNILNGSTTSDLRSHPYTLIYLRNQRDPAAFLSRNPYTIVVGKHT